MSDRSYVEIHVRKEDEEKVVSFARFDDRADDDQQVILMEQEAAWAYDTELQEIAAEGIPFFGCHGDGYNYSSMQFACDGKELVYVNAHEGNPVVAVGRNGKPSKNDLAEVAKYRRVLKRAKQLVMEKRR